MSIIWSFFLNSLVGFIVTVSFAFAIPDISATLDPATNPSGSVFFYVFQQASDRGSVVLTTMILAVFLGGAINGAASTSRNFWAFARDGGTPWRAWLSKVRIGCVSRKFSN
jgi:choline transport protein